MTAYLTAFEMTQCDADHENDNALFGRCDGEDYQAGWYWQDTQGHVEPQGPFATLDDAMANMRAEYPTESVEVHRAK